MSRSNHYDMTSREIRSPLKWAGGKRWLAPYLAEIWVNHDHRRLIEPFCGGLAVALSLRPAMALLNDANPHLVNFLQCLKDGLTIEIDMRNDKELYYAHRDRFNDLIACSAPVRRSPPRSGSSVRSNESTKQPNASGSQVDCGADREVAALFYYLNRTGYNGLCRFNKDGQFNVPFGKYKTIRYRRSFEEYREILANWDFTCGDFEDMSVDSGDFIYADPPYDVEFTHYSRGGFPWEDQIRLADWLAKHPGPVVASNQATPRIIEMYRDLGFQLRFLNAPRMISCTGDRSKVQEILATKGV